MTAAGTMTAQTQNHDFPVGTVAGVYRLALTPPPGPPPPQPAIVKLVLYTGALAPVVAAFDVPVPFSGQGSADLMASDGSTVLWGAPPQPVEVVPPPARPGT